MSELATIARGRILRRPAAGELAPEHFLYVPSGARDDAPLLVAVHGYSRDAREQAEHFAPLCERAGAVLVAPHFDAERFGDYQRLGRRGARSDRALQALLGALRAQLGLLLGRVTLFGYSGGGQFAHRYALAHPGHLASAVVAAPGWYTFPDAERRYPFGTRVGRRLAGVRLRAEAFLRVPLVVAVGARDDDPASENLRHTPELDLQQGTHRLERARHFVREMERAARALGFAPRIRLAILPRAGHSFAECMANGLGELVLEQLASFGCGADARLAVAR